jgi:hypothetical protein
MANICHLTEVECPVYRDNSTGRRSADKKKGLGFGVASGLVIFFVALVGVAGWSACGAAAASRVQVQNEPGRVPLVENVAVIEATKEYTRESERHVNRARNVFALNLRSIPILPEERLGIRRRLGECAERQEPVFDFAEFTRGLAEIVHVKTENCEPFAGPAIGASPNDIVFDKTKTASATARQISPFYAGDVFSLDEGYSPQLAGGKPERSSEKPDDQRKESGDRFPVVFEKLATAGLSPSQRRDDLSNTFIRLIAGSVVVVFVHALLKRIGKPNNRTRNNYAQKGDKP